METGVARGITSRFVLEGLERNGAGRLWSIDLPPFRDRELRAQIGAAVPAPRRDRWTLIGGSSRRCLPRLLRELGEIELFIHDSLHTERNLCFELDRAWPALTPGGLALADDVHRNCGFRRFTAATPQHRSLVCPSDDERGLFGVTQNKAAATGTRRAGAG